MARRLALFLLVGLFLLPFAVQAKGAFQSIIVTDTQTGLSYELAEVPALQEFFVFDWQQGAVEAPTVSSNGIELRRGAMDEGDFRGFDLLIYYPEAPDTIFYAGLINSDGELCSGCSEYDGKWYQLMPEARTEFASLFSAPSVQPVNWLQTISAIMGSVLAIAAG